MISNEVLDGLMEFLDPNTRYDVKKIALESIAELSGSPTNLEIIFKRDDISKALFMLADAEDFSISEDALKTLVNLTAVEKMSKCVLRAHSGSVQILAKVICNPLHPYADLACGALANITRVQDNIKIVIDALEEGNCKVEKMVSIFCQPEYNTDGATLNLLGMCISNLTQNSQGRKLVMSKSCFESLLSFIGYPGSMQRRLAAVSAVHNCCFEKDYHEWLLGDEVSIASYLALPLAGPEVLSDEDNCSLPLDLQYLPETKKREPESTIRILLLESLMQLCATRKSRETLRDLNIYLILREYHKWETDSKCMDLLEDLVNLLIKTEPEIGEDDLSQVKIPDDLEQKFDAELKEQNEKKE